MLCCIENRVGSDTSDSDVAANEQAVEEEKEVQEGEEEEPAEDDETKVSPEQPSDASIFDQDLSEGQLAALEEEFAQKILQDMGLAQSPDGLQPGWLDDWEGSEVADLPRLSKVKTLVTVQDQAPEQTAVESFDDWCGPASTAFTADDPPSVERPALATIAASKYLTNPENGADYAHGERRVLHVELDLTKQGTQDVDATLGSYVPGDAIGVLAPNVAEYVGLVLARLRKAYGTHPHSVVHVLERVSDDRYRQEQTLVEALKYRVDLQTTPRRKILRQLCEFCSDEGDQMFLERLCSKDKQHKGFQELVLERFHLRLGEIFALCKSLCPPADALLSLLPPSLPRYYSIASSPLASKSANGSSLSTKMTLAFSVVEYDVQAGAARKALFPGTDVSFAGLLRRKGLATSWFERVCREMQSGQRTDPP
eukprot:scaffold463_cov242-Pinguiococcus_pyrenoidosus.AAC.1